MPSWTRFAEQGAEYRRGVLGTGLRIGIEAGCSLGWERWLGDDGVFIGMNGFGASAPAPHLYEHFGITEQSVAAAGRRLLSAQ